MSFNFRSLFQSLRALMLDFWDPKKVVSSMIHDCPPPASSGPPNPGKSTPPVHLQAHGHTLGKKSNRPGKLTKARGRKAQQYPAGTGGIPVTVCEDLPGQRSVPNPQRGRPSNSSVIIGPKTAGILSLRFDFNPATQPTDNTLSISFRQGTVYHWDGVTSEEATAFFPGRNFSSGFTLTDAPDISHALRVFNGIARRTFLNRPADRRSFQTPASSLVWNPGGAVPTNTTQSAGGTGQLTVTVLAANGKSPTGVLQVLFGPLPSYTLVSADNGIHVFDFTTVATSFLSGITAQFNGTSSFAASTAAVPSLSITIVAGTSAPPLDTISFQVSGYPTPPDPSQFVTSNVPAGTGSSTTTTFVSAGTYLLVAQTNQSLSHYRSISLDQWFVRIAVF